MRRLANVEAFYRNRFILCFASSGELSLRDSLKLLWVISAPFIMGNSRARAAEVVSLRASSRRFRRAQARGERAETHILPPENRFTRGIDELEIGHRAEPIYGRS
jgi:hypothetical protein